MNRKISKDEFISEFKALKEEVKVYKKKLNDLRREIRRKIDSKAENLYWKGQELYVEDEMFLTMKESFPGLKKKMEQIHNFRNYSHEC